MIAIVTVLVALPAGYFLASRLAASTTYAVVYLWAFVYQTLYLQLDGSAFRTKEFPLSYGLVTAGIFAAGFGLVAVGHGLRRRRRASGHVTSAPAEPVSGGSVTSPRT